MGWVYSLTSDFDLVPELCGFAGRDLACVDALVLDLCQRDDERVAILRLLQLHPRVGLLDDLTAQGHDVVALLPNDDVAS